MHSKLHVLIASRSKAALANLAAELDRRSAYKVDVRHIENGHADPLWGLSYVPDVLVFVLDGRGEHDLSELIEVQSSTRPPMVVLAEQGDARTMRLAMQAGARDFLAEISAEDLIASIERISAQLVSASTADAKSLTAFVNAKGGSGATFLACNVAHMLASVSSRATALLSLDMQFESLAQCFDTKIRHDLLRVLATVEDLDEVALEASMTRHDSGLRMLAAGARDLIECHGDKAGKVGLLLDKMTAQYDHVVLDVPRRLDNNVVPVLARATRIVLVVQQTLSHLRDAARMLDIFGAHGVSDDRILVVVNRFEKNSPVQLADVQRALKGLEAVVVPSDFKTVAESINLGVPMYDHARRCAVTKALVALEARLAGSVEEPSSGPFAKALSSLLRKESWSPT
jgi:pilus assembly protein CpaE